MKKIFCLFLALIMCFGSAVAMYAEEKSKVYISDIKIGYGQKGKQALINAGYKVNSNFDANKNGRGDTETYGDASVWIGFKETNNPLDAITDIAVMNMNGGYTFSGWAEEYQKIQDQVEEMYTDFKVGILEFRENFNNGSPYAQAAYELMNYFLDTGFTGNSIGDLFLDDNSSEDDIFNVFLIGNYEYITLIKQCIAVACTEWQLDDDGNTDTFVTRLNSNGYCTQDPDPSYNHEREIISEAITNLRPEIVEAETNRSKYYKTYSVNKDLYKLEEKDIPEGCSAEELDELQFENYIKSQCTEGEIGDYYYYKSLINLLKNVTIKPEQKNSKGEITQAKETLYDLVKKDSTLLVENDFETIRLAMTAGQIGVLSAIGLPLLLLYEDGISSGTFAEEFEKTREKYEEVYGSDPISVYYGVDVSIFTDPDSTALSSDAYRAFKSGDTSNFGVNPEEDRNSGKGLSSKARTYLIILGSAFGVGFIAWITLLIVNSKVAAIGLETVTRVRIGLYAVIIIAVILIIIFLFLTLGAIDEDEDEDEPDLPDIEYTRIPKSIVNLKTKFLSGVGDQNVYYTYTCAERIDANKNSSNTLDIYGDLNQYNKKNQWVAVYYTKNRDCGDPITSKVVLSESSSCPEGYVAIHEFGMDTAADLNKFNSGENKKSIYGYVETTTFETTQNGNGEDLKMSVFSTGTTVMLSVAAFAAGALVSGVVTYSGTKKKYKKA